MERIPVPRLIGGLGVAAALAALVIAPSTASAESLASLSVLAPPVLPTYRCERGRGSTACRSYFRLSQPRTVSGSVVLDGAQPVGGAITIVYNQYAYAGLLRFGRAGLRTALGTGSAQATWGLTLDDEQRSQLWGSLESRRIDVRRARGSRLTLSFDYAVEVSGGTGRFAGQTGDCGTGRCDFVETATIPVRRSSQLPQTDVAGAARGNPAARNANGSMNVQLATGPPKVEPALPPNTTLEQSDPRPLQVAAPPGSVCTAIIEARPAGAAPTVELGSVTSDASGTARFEGSLAARIAAFPGGNAQTSITCSDPVTPLAPITPAVEDVTARRTPILDVVTIRHFGRAIGESDGHRDSVASFYRPSIGFSFHPIYTIGDLMVTTFWSHQTTRASTIIETIPREKAMAAVSVDNADFDDPSKPILRPPAGWDHVGDARWAPPGGQRGPAREGRVRVYRPRPPAANWREPQYVCLGDIVVPIQRDPPEPDHANFPHNYRCVREDLVTWAKFRPPAINVDPSSGKILALSQPNHAFRFIERDDMLVEDGIRTVLTLLPTVRLGPTQG